MILLLLGMVNRVSDEELVRRFKDGRRDAFSEIVRRYQDRVYGVCLRFFGGDAALAEDVAQDVFIALFKSLEGFRGDSLLSTWITRVALNHCKNKELYRKRRGHGRTESIDAPQGDDDEPIRQLADSGPGTDDPLRQAQAERILAEGLASLDDEHREVLLLRDVEELSYEEIAEILDLPKGTVKSRIHRARNDLRKRLFRSGGVENAG